jgi:hypothetical protein
MTELAGAVTIGVGADTRDAISALKGIKEQFTQLAAAGRQNGSELSGAMDAVKTAVSRVVPNVKELIDKFNTTGATAVMKSELSSLQGELKKTAAEFRQTGATYESELGQKLKGLSSRVNAAKAQLRILQSEPTTAGGTGNVVQFRSQAQALALVENAAIRTSSKIRQYGEAIGNAAYEYGPWTGAHVQAAQAIGVTLTEAISKANLALKVLAVSLGVAGLAAAGLGAVVLASRETIGELGQLEGAAKLAGVSLRDLQALQRAAVVSGGTRDGMTTALQGIAKAANGAAREENEFSKILEANNVKLTDSAGNLRSTMSLLSDYARLVQHAKTEQDKLVLMEAIGSDKDMISFFSQGADKIRELADEAVKTGETIDAKVIQRAHEFDVAWKRTMDSFAIGWRASVMDVLALFDKLRAAIPAPAGTPNSPEAVAGRRLGGDIGSVIRQKQGKAPVWAGALGDGKFDDSDYAGSMDAGRKRLAKLMGKQDTVIPKSKDSGGKAAKEPADEAKDAVERYIDSLKKANETAKAEALTWDKSNVDRAEAVALAQAKAAADRDDLTLTKAQTAEISRTARETQNLKDKTEQVRSAAKGMSDMFASALDGLIVKGEKLNDIIKNLLQNLASAVLKGALSGEGMFGALGGAAGSGGLMGSLFKPLAAAIAGARADGGPVMGGKAYVVGERGPELFQPNGGGTIIPNGGGAGGSGASQMHVNINLAGANGDAAIHSAVMRGLQAGLAQFSTAVLPGRLNEIQLRGV